jgi:protein-S-isoprenylcysteine O-methyltransferase Ste14
MPQSAAARTGPEVVMSVAVRATLYVILFVGLVLVFVPARLLVWVGIDAPDRWGPRQVLGAAAALGGLLLALWCVVTFVREGRGTPAVFDPPRRLVTGGPYRFVRNPMYIGAGLALGGAAVSLGSVWLAVYLGLLGVAAHLFIVRHEEPTLRRSFGRDYADYCRAVGRWVPRR